eukprot:7768643-Pyramimonas_sp.AAC.1
MAVEAVMSTSCSRAASPKTAACEITPGRGAFNPEGGGIAHPGEVILVVTQTHRHRARPVRARRRKSCDFEEPWRGTHGTGSMTVGWRDDQGHLALVNWSLQRPSSRRQKNVVLTTSLVQTPFHRADPEYRSLAPGCGGWFRCGHRADPE